MPKTTRRHRRGPVPALTEATFYTIEFSVWVGKTRNKKRAPRTMEVDVWAASVEDAVVQLARKLHIDPVFPE